MFHKSEPDKWEGWGRAAKASLKVPQCITRTKLPGSCTCPPLLLLPWLILLSPCYKCQTKAPRLGIKDVLCHGLLSRATATEFWKIKNLNQKETSLLVHDILCWRKKKMARSGHEKWLRNTPDHPLHNYIKYFIWICFFTSSHTWFLG